MKNRGHGARIGIALSGGGARGLAQIGVIRVLERNKIPIDAIVGNSFGSVIGGLYAAGYSVAEIESIALSTNWSELLSFSEETQRRDLFVGQKQIQQEGFLDIRFEGLQPIIPSSISGGQRLSNLFSYLTLQALYHPDSSFGDLKIPYRAVATDLLSGRQVVMGSGSMAEAMRASVAVPLLYAPLEKDSMFLVDGGLISNIPVDVARDMGCDIVIAVNSTSPMRTADQLTKPWEIADQIMAIMMQESNERQLALADVVITPDAKGRLVSDFSNIEQLIIEGERATEARIEDIKALLRRKTQAVMEVSSQTSLTQSIAFSGESIPPEIRDDLLSRSRNGSLSLTALQEGIDRLAARGLFSRVYAEVTDANIVLYADVNPLLEGVVFHGNALVSDTLIRREFHSLIGKPIEEERIRTAFEGILRRYRREGYSLARVESVSVDTDSGLLRFVLNEGVIRQIRYEGNEQTRDYIIRREFPLDEGDVFNIREAARGIINIKSTGLFEYVLIDVRYRENRPVVILRVKEKSASLLRFGIHADNEHSLVSTVVLRDVNFRGAGEDVGLTLRYGFRDRLARLDYTINRIFHSYFTLSVGAYVNSRDVFTYRDDPDVSGKQWDRIEDGKYRENKIGGTLRFGSYFERFGYVTAELRTEEHQIVSISGQGYVPDRYRFVGLQFRTIVDTEDKYTFPTDGMYLSLSYESAQRGFGSDVSFGKISGLYESYSTPWPRHTIRPRISFGFADATLPIAEQYSLGGLTSFFGLREDDSRGRQIFVLNLEYRYWLPFKLIFETYLKARYDLGTISKTPQELKLVNFRHGFGGELSVDTPLGEASFGMGKSFFVRQDLPDLPVSVGPLLLYFTIGHSL